MPRATTAKKQSDEELQGEYVVGGNSWLSADTLYLDQFNPYNPLLTPEARQRLRRDSEVKSSLSMLADSIFSESVTVVPSVTNEDDPEFEGAGEIAAFIDNATSDPQRPLETVLREMFKEAFIDGVKVAEIVLRPDEDQLVLDRINPKPNSSVAFFCDKFLNVLGIVPVNQLFQPSEGIVTVDGKKVIRRDHFIVLNFELCDNDPRGIEEIDAAFEDWCDKQDTRKQWKEWRRTSAIPKKVGITGPAKGEMPVKDSSGNTVLENGRPKTITPEKALMNALEGFANNSVVTAPNGTTIQQLEVQGTGQQFTTALKYQNSQIRKVIVGDALTTGEADKDARAARESAKDVSDIRKQNFRRAISSTVKKDLFRLLTIVNFGEEKAHLTPDCFLGDTEANDWATDVQAAASAGYTFAEEHFRQLDAQFGVDPREKAEKSADKKPENRPAEAGEEDEQL
ncbi:MAG: DUF935 family protein [Bacteroidetes bacterium]|nr:DUF935 family protein [Bacteroidota bacterium]